MEEGDALAPRVGACAEPPSSEKSLYVLSWLQVCWALSVAGRIAYGFKVTLSITEWSFCIKAIKCSNESPIA